MRKRMDIVLSTGAFLGIFGVLAVGCGEPQDPLARDRARLTAAINEDLPPQWPAEATIVIGSPLLRSQLEGALLAAIEDAKPFLKIRGQFGELDVVPVLTVDALRFDSSDDCANCVAVTSEISGTVGAKMGGGAFGGFGLSSPFQGTATATVEIMVVSSRTENPSSTTKGPMSKTPATKTAPDAPALKRTVAVVPRPGTWKIGLKLEGLPEALSNEAETIVQNAIQDAVAKQKLRKIEVAELPSNDVVDVKGMRARATPNGLAVDLAFATLKRGKVKTPADAADGWVAHLPEDTILGIAHAAALRAGVQDGWAPEPIAFKVADDKFVLTLKMWRVKAEPDFRTIEVVGRIVIGKDGTVQVVSDDVREVGEGSGFTLDPVVLVTRAILLEEIRRGLSAVVPTDHAQSLGAAGTLRVKLERAVLRAGAIELFGSVVIDRTGPVTSMVDPS